MTIEKPMTSWIHTCQRHCFLWVIIYLSFYLIDIKIKISLSHFPFISRDWNIIPTSEIPTKILFSQAIINDRTFLTAREIENLAHANNTALRWGFSRLRWLITRSNLVHIHAHIHVRILLILSVVKWFYVELESERNR